MTPEDEKAKALEAFDKCKSTLLNGSVQSYLIPLQHVDTIRKALAPAPVAGDLAELMNDAENFCTAAVSSIQVARHKMAQPAKVDGDEVGEAVDFFAEYNEPDIYADGTMLGPNALHYIKTLIQAATGQQSRKRALHPSMLSAEDLAAVAKVEVPEEATSQQGREWMDISTAPTEEAILFLTDKNERVIGEKKSMGGFLINGLEKYEVGDVCKILKWCHLPKVPS